jgi:hypothetical protein
MSDLKYYTVQAPRSSIATSGDPSSRIKTAEAGADAANYACVELHEWAISRRINDEVEKFSDQIKKVMPNGAGGVLVYVDMHEWETPDFPGNRAQSLQSIYIVGSGLTPGPILERYLRQPRLMQGPNPGWRRKPSYIWVTRSTADRVLPLK